jgi:hypothetical protein
MASRNHHSLDSLLEAMLDPTSHSLASSSDPADESAADGNIVAAPSVLDAPSTILYAKDECPNAVTLAVDESTECATAVVLEFAASILPDSAVFAECPKPRKPGFGPLFQVWHEWTFFSIVSQQAICPKSREPVTTSRVTKLCLWQGQPYDY